MRKYLNILGEEHDFDVEINSEDHMNPERMTERKVLYRSVSIPELVSICFTGSITGGNNKFNGFDPRRYVFFADELNEHTIWQGEDHSRYPTYALSNHPIHQEEQDLNREIEELGQLAYFSLKAAVRKTEAAAAKAGRRTPEFDYNAAYEELAHGGTRMASDYAFASSQLRDLIAEIKAAVAKRHDLNPRYREAHGEASRAFDASLKTWGVSSGVIVTKPISGGVLYRKEHDTAAFGGNEYGFASGDVTWREIDHYLLVKDGVVLPGSYDDSGDVMRKLKELGVPFEDYLQ